MASFPTINKAPGVYIQEITLPGPIAGASTSIAAFVGPAQMGPLLTPTMLTSVKQFGEVFGSYIETPYRSYAAHAVNGFFAEGGEQCYFVRVGNGVPAWLNLLDQGTPQQKTLVVTAQQEGAAGDTINVEVDTSSLASTTVVNPSSLTVAAITAQTPLATISGTTTGNVGVTVDTATGFAPGDLVNVSGTVGTASKNENALIASITTTGSGASATTTINFLMPLTNSYSAGYVVKRDRVTVTTAAGNFLPGDVVALADSASGNTENATIASITTKTTATTTTATIFFQSPLTNNYATGTGTIAPANLAVGATTIRVASTIGLEPGSYITITNTTKTDYNVVNLVNSVNNVLTLANGLTNPYPMGVGTTVTVTSMEFTVKVTGIPVAETYPNLAMDSRHSRYFGNIVNSGFINIALANPPSTTPPPLNVPAAITASPLSGGVDDDLKHVTTAHYHAGIDALKKFTDVNLLCVPDAVTTVPSGNSHFQIADTHDIQSYMVAHCESMQDRFAILDPSQFDPSYDFTYNAIQLQRQGLNSNNGYGGLYFPWIAISNPFGSGQILVPPSGHVAGVYSKNDNNYGVFKAPANEPIVNALALDANLSDDEQGPLNSAGINVIRSFSGGGIVIWGARTITPASLVPWRFINVRRLLLFIEKSIQEGTRFAVFEPNNQTLWGQLKRIVDDFLTTQWQEGALFGDTADKAFRVVVDETNNPPSIRAQGILIVQVTVVPTTPAEFIVFQVIQDITGASLQEST